MKNALVLGGGGFIGGHLAKRLKEEGFWVCVVDIKKKPEFFEEKEICHKYISHDLRINPSNVFLAPNQTSLDDSENAFDEVYNLSADMGGAGYIFSGENDFDVMTNSATINLNVIKYCIKFNVKKVFFSSSACVYPEYNQTNADKPITKEDTVYPAAPDSEYGWEKLFSERVFLAAAKNYGIDVRVARYHNIYGPNCSWNDGKEKAPAAMCRKVAESNDSIEMWGDGNQTRSFLYIDDCLDATTMFMRGKDFKGPINIGSEEMVSINGLARVVMDIANKKLNIDHIDGPLGVRGRSSHNDLIRSIFKWEPKYRLVDGLKPTYEWIKKQIA